ncbi:MAG: DNA-protecting protein DprA [Treponema sp.]|jgi:DNA processing protein|nr:DNA-protecting protein DprA [Treponema sp.]
MQNDAKDELLVLALASASFLTLKEKIILMNKLDSARMLALLSIKDISSIIGRVSHSETWNGKKAVYEAERTLCIMHRFGCAYTLYGSEDYPSLLTQIVDAPFLLFYRGNIGVLNRDCIAVVGTRRVTADGRSAAYDFSYDACCDAKTVVSGLALGIDGEAHKGSVASCFDAHRADGKTVAVLPSGIDVIVPGVHRRLAGQILESGGCLVSEYAPGVPALPWRFVQRNRIIAGVAAATVVIQAPPGSGALVTADFAVEYNRDVLFHQASFSSAAKFVAEHIRQQLEIEVSRGIKNRSKLQRCVEKYVEAGAPVIADYKDFLHCEAEPPGTRKIKTDKESQISLFDD